MKSICQIVLLVLCCIISARESDSTFIPGRCICPQTMVRVRGQLTDLKVYPQTPTCNKVTVLVTLKSNNQTVCLNPDALLGKMLTRCWNRAHKLGRDTKLCLRRRRKRRGRNGQQKRSRQRSQAHSRGASSSD